MGASEPDTPTPSGVVPADVAVLLRARTKDSQGREVGLFNEDTRPTVSQVETAIAFAERTIRTRVGTPGEACSEAFAVAVVHEAACQIEKSYWPEQVLSERSPYEHLRVEAEAAIRGLEACVGEFGGDENGGRATVYDVVTPPACAVPGDAWWPEHVLGNWNPPEPIDP